MHDSMWKGTQCSYIHLLQPSCQFKHLSPFKCALREASVLGGSCATAKPCLDGLYKHGTWEGKRDLLEENLL